MSFSDLPSVNLAMECLEDLSESESGSTSNSASSDADEMDFQMDYDEDVSFTDVTDYQPTSTFENLPTEIMQQISINLDTDHDLRELIFTCKTTAEKINPDDSPVWRERFLVQYDYPKIDRLIEFSFAYKLRNFVLRNFVGCGNGKDKRVQIQLEVLRDMILEAFNSGDPKHPQRSSRNLALFSSSYTSPWLTKFLSSPFFDHEKSKYGHPHQLFDALQLCFSYILLTPPHQSGDQKAISSRDHYDLATVYRWNQPFNTLYSRVPYQELEPENEFDSEVKSTLFPNLQIQANPPARREPKCELDLYKLLHIRNFWHRHLVDDPTCESMSHSETTYAGMARRLQQLGLGPNPWESILQDPNDTIEATFPNIREKWFGHYSCLYPWAKSQSDLEERQTSAEDWDEVDPLTLDISSTHDDPDQSSWPPIFSTIPAFTQTTPSPTTSTSSSSSSTTYIRGLAPFFNLSNQGIRSRDPLHRHNYLSLRVRGLIHSIPPQTSIPGWQRLTMVLYKPTTRYLIQALEHHEQAFGDAFSTTLSAQLQSTTNAAQIERLLTQYLKHKLRSDETYLSLDREAILRLEDSFCAGAFLDWADIEYAYAYEGVVLPGGRLMLGRWWRCGALGSGDGRECGVDGLALDQDGEEALPQGGSALGNNKRAERGPFVFWS